MMPSASRSTDGLTLLLAGDLLVDATAVRALRDAGRGPVWTAAGRRVGVVCAAADLPACSESIDLGAGWPVHGSTPLEPMREGTRIAAGLAVPLEAPGSAGHLERALLEHIGDRTTSDSYLATLIDRPLSRPLTRLLLRTSLAPAHVTLLSVAIGLLGAAGLATVSYWGRLGGVLLLLASIVLDCVDGDLARARLAQTAAGARLDVMGDYLVHLAVFLGLATGLWREGLPPGGVWAALALVAGVVAAMAAVHVLFIRPALRQGGDLHWAGDAESFRGRRGASIAEKLASRDYTYLLLVLAVLGHLEWFLYAAAGGAWVFTAALIAYWLLGDAAAAGAGSGAPVTGLRRRGIELACLVLGVAVLAGTVWTIGAETLVGDLRTLGWGLAAILLVEEPERPPEHRRLGARFPGRRAAGRRRETRRRPTGRRRRQLPHAVGDDRGRASARALAGAARSLERPMGVGERREGRPVAGPGGLHPARDRHRLPGPRRRTRVARMGVPRSSSRPRRARWPSRPGLAFVWAVDRGFWTAIQGALGANAPRLAPAGVVGRPRTRSRRHPRARRRVAGVRALGCFVAGWAVGALEIYLILRWVGDAVDWQTALGPGDGLGAHRWYSLLRARQGRNAGGGQGRALRGPRAQSGPRSHGRCRATHPGAGLRGSRSGCPRMDDRSRRCQPSAAARLGEFTQRAPCLRPPWLSGRCSSTRRRSRGSTVARAPGIRRGARSARSGIRRGWPSRPRWCPAAVSSTPRPTA